MEFFLPYIIMYLLFSILLMYIFQIIGKNSFLAFIPLYSMYIALKFFKGRIYYRNWGMFYVIGTILVIPIIYIIVGIITEYHKSQSVQYSSNPWAGFGEFMTGIFFMFFFINLILIIGNMLVYLPIIKDRLWVCVLFVVWNIYYLFKFVIYMIIEPGNFLVFYTIYIINILMNLFFIFYIANIYKKLQLENKIIVSEIDYDKYPRSEIKRMIRSRNYNLFENNK
ncbi:hypothetical protein O3797_05575 [Gemella sanguinis]|uniref:hypothetical protein n=1 Tax=Gemella sanguinis TaxID=84135 RepID=UPI0008076623|nr:hypothetical protein [Gemella sanguinis]